MYGIFALVRSRSMVARLTHAQELEPEAAKPLRQLVENVSIGAGLPVTPEIRIVDDPAPNAYAAGLRPEKSYVGVTTGLLATMPQRELEAVLAHEVAHIRNRDTYLMTIALVFAGVIALIADIGFRSLAYGGRSRKGGAIVVILAIVGFILAPYAALLLRLSLSRRREFLADAGAAEILNDPEAMALALRRLQADPTTVQVRGGLDGPPLGREPDRPRRSTLPRRQRDDQPLQHAPADRRAHRGARGSRRVPAARPAPADEPFGVEHRLV